MKVQGRYCNLERKVGILTTYHSIIRRADHDATYRNDTGYECWNLCSKSRNL